MLVYGRMRRSLAGAVTRSSALPLAQPVLPGGRNRLFPPVIYKRPFSRPTSSCSKFLCHGPARISVSHAPPTSKVRRFYSARRSAPTSKSPSSFSERVQEALFFRPSTWFVFAIASAAAGATAVLMSTADFISYTDEESLKVFQPSAPKQIEIEEYINKHPLAQSLRSKPEFTESRPTLKVHEEYRNSSLTSGALAGPGKIEVPPYVWQEGGKSLVSILYVGQELCGYPGLIHGGLLATLLDEGLARCCFPALPNKIGLTANLTINYRKPSPAGSFVVLKAKTVKVEGRKAWVEGHIETLSENGEDPVVLVEATALMVEPKQAKMFRSLIPAK